MLFGETVAVHCENHTEHTDTVRTSQETHHVSATKPNRLMLFRETVAFYSENHTEHTDTVRTSQETYITYKCNVWAQRRLFRYVKGAGTCSNHRALQG
jgi:hypothetical protein